MLSGAAEQQQMGSPGGMMGMEGMEAGGGGAGAGGGGVDGLMEVPGMLDPHHGFNTTMTKVFVGGLAWQTTSETLRTYFARFGQAQKKKCLKSPLFSPLYSITI